MSECKPAMTPMAEVFFTGYDAEEGKAVVDVELYRQIIGSLLYLALRTRPDVLVAVSILTRFIQSPTAYCHRGARRGTCVRQSTWRSCIGMATRISTHS
jgi:hypothetical protein